MQISTERHALIVEDDLIIGVGMQLHLAELGFSSFAFAGTGLQALEQARLRRPDLVTVDIGLLDGDGVETAHALTGEFGVLPMIYVTGDPRRLVQEPGVVVVEKPFGFDELKAAYARLAL